MPIIRISTAAYEKLRSMASGWETQKQTVDRILGITAAHPRQSGGGEARGRHNGHKPGWRTSKHDFYLPILTAVQRVGGSAPTAKVIEEVGGLMRSKLTPADLRTLESGAIRWVNTVHWAWQSLKNAGLMEASPKGVWAISPAGRKAAVAKTLPPSLKGNHAV